MNKMIKLAVGVVTTAALGEVAMSTGYAGINMQGPLLSGIALQSLESNQPLIAAVTLPSGETIDLHQQATDSSGQGITMKRPRGLDQRPPE